MVLVWFWDGLGIVLALFWDGFRIVFGSVQDRLGGVRESLGMFCVCLGMAWGWFWNRFGIFFAWFKDRFRVGPGSFGMC